MEKINFHITEIKKEDRSMVSSFISENWGSTKVITRGKIHNTEKLSGFIYKENKKLIGLITYNIEKDKCEIVSLNSNQENKGLGCSLINKVIDIAIKKECKKLWLITTNDNTKAIRFYQKRGFEWKDFHRNSIKESRKLKPQIPEFGYDNIPMKHEIEFELTL